MMHSTAATAPSERVLAPDLARGLMLALIALANVMIYLVGRPYGFRQHIIEDGVINHVVQALMVTLVDGRAYPLFAFLFGYGMVQLSEHRRRSGASPEDVRRLMRRRSLVLLLFGAVHGIVLFPGDILGWYGIVGLLIVALIPRPDRSLLRSAVLWLMPAALVTGLIYGQAAGPGRSFFWSFEVADPLTAAGLRFLEWLMAPFGLLPVITAALVGVVAARHRVLENPRTHRRLLGRVAGGGITLAVAGGLPSGLIAGGYLPGPDATASSILSVLHTVTGVAGGLGLAAAFALLADKPAVRSARVVAAIAATGRRSLSAYLSQSLIFVLLLGLPFGGFGSRWGSAAAAALALSVWAASVVASAALQRRGIRGPAERLLRRLATIRVRQSKRVEDLSP